MMKIIAVLAFILTASALSFPVNADINQKADLIGGNAAVVKVKQEAWNYGSGNVNQYTDVLVSGNIQILDQDNVVVITDPDVMVNNTINGINLIIVDLNQGAENHGSGNVSQGIEVAVEGNIQILNQDINVFLGNTENQVTTERNEKKTITKG
ncbi:hypothetical protein [Candidatus Methanoperedens nitratireducens]|uniref:Uncharacterized protein n=1 Tax=Candidatus Methanoperedens nitratireducens TaxID=1392998 RepID=A0A284VTD8_9EURY|nr:hypothetical protein [Candidatus Methanoperedens nitroreducens]SNQ62566.1 exported hypothetical protein [Candidatus Methanoperedens nitroreducens]